ncbi:hypothetical protein QA596_05535 [Balneolales bacterium ANBcel1]|nr:hypothetical protein [Balneolales bacterium ANBcel1]
MKKILLLILVLLLGSQAVNAQETIGFTDPDQTLHLENYRLPDWGYDLLYLDFDGSFRAVNDFNDWKNRNTAGRINPVYFFYRESEKLVLDARAQLPMQLFRNHQEDPNENEITDRQFRTDLALNGTGRYYFEHLLFGIGQASFDLNTNRRAVDRDVGVDQFQRRTDSRLQLSGGIGYGRVRDVTPVIRALRFNERMNAVGVGELNDAQIQGMANVFARRTGFNRRYDRPARHFWNEVGQIAPDQLGSLSFYEAYFLTETLMETTGQRFQGWDGNATVFVDHQRFTDEREEDGNTLWDLDGSETRIGVNLGGRMFHNLNLEQMFSARANIGLGMATYSDEDDNESLFQVGFEVGHLYNLTDRILIQSAISNNYEKLGSGDDSVSDRVFRINSAVTYFIENNIAVTGSVAYVHDRRDFGNVYDTRSDFRLDISLRYYFMRSLF